MAEQNQELENIAISAVAGGVEGTKRSLKRPLADDENESEDHKRRRTDHDRNAAAGDIDSVERGPIGLGPFHKFCQKSEFHQVQLCCKIGSMLTCL